MQEAGTALVIERETGLGQIEDRRVLEVHRCCFGLALVLVKVEADLLGLQVPVGSPRLAGGKTAVAEQETIFPLEINPLGMAAGFRRPRRWRHCRQAVVVRHIAHHRRPR